MKGEKCYFRLNGIFESELLTEEMGKKILYKYEIVLYTYRK